MSFSLKEIRKDIEFNFKLKVYFQEEMDRLYIDHNKMRLSFDLIGKVIYASVHGTLNDKEVYDNTIITNPDHVMWYLLQYCKDVHRYGEFKNEN